MDMPANVRLERRYAKEWSGLLKNPFVNGLRYGTLPVEAFRSYLVQDALYLDSMTRALLEAAARSPDLSCTRRLVALVHEVLSGELLDESHGDFVADAEIPADTLRASKPEPVTSAYGDYLRVTAMTDTLCVFLGSVLPCASTYLQIGRALRRSPGAKRAPYRRWVAFYASPAYARHVREYESMFNALWPKASAEERRRAETCFAKSVEYERLFWEMPLSRNGLSR